MVRPIWPVLLTLIFFVSAPVLAQYDYYSDDELSKDYKVPPNTEDTVDITEEEPEEISEAGDEEPTQLGGEPVPSIRRGSKDTPVYDGKKRYINHPMAEKGLIYIDREKVHFYEVKPSKQDKAASVRLGFFDPTEFENFSTVYTDSSQPMILFDYEWQLWQTAVGKFGIVAGTGIYVAQGTGRFENQNNLEPLEKFTFFVFPNHASVVYRMQFSDNQWFVPYAMGGVDYFTFAERRDDDKNPDIGAKLGGAFATHFAGGAALSLGALNRATRINLDREYGINDVWLTGEFRTILGTGTYNFTSQMITAGMMVEF